MKKLIDALSNRLRVSVLNEASRKRVQFQSLCAVLAIVAAVMTVVNVFTDKMQLGIVTAVFAVICAAIYLLSVKRTISYNTGILLFVCAFYLLFAYFIISGDPEGFSILWICLLPSFGLLLFGRRNGTIACAGMLLMLIFFFQTGFGSSLLQFNYTQSTRLRFPILFCAFYAVAFFLETIRAMTYGELAKMQEKYRYLYSHDALTGVYNRHGFNEQMDARLLCGSGAALIIMDIDNFKSVNDNYGHQQGDVVLFTLAHLISKRMGDDGSICRWGGEEFAVLPLHPEDTKKIADSLCAAIADEPIELETCTVHITVSVGAVLMREGGEISAAKLVNRADACLYRAKDEGRDRVVYEEI